MTLIRLYVKRCKRVSCVSMVSMTLPSITIRIFFFIKIICRCTKMV
ncbi:Uncharacterised protein [Vibrio cholerae]|nr:Uncharacterised protein [Vibrio cholerae]